MQKKSTKSISNSFLRYSSYVIALGGFLFGYDTGVINGALAFMSKPGQLNLSPGLQGVVSSSLVLGACCGALASGQIADKIGRRRSLRAVALVFTISTIFCAFAMNFVVMTIFRFILGLAVGAASSLSPMYLAEISPDAVRTSNVNKNAVFIVLGQLTAFCMNALLGNLWGDWGPIWRVMIILASVPAIILWINSFHIVNSPHWLLLQKQFAKAQRAFKKLGFDAADLARIKEPDPTKKRSAAALSWKRILTSPSLCYLLFSGIIVALIQQISGVNTVMYYGTILLEKTGMGQSGSLYANILIGVVSVIASIIGTQMIDKYNHHRMLLIGLAGNIIFLALLAAVLHFNLLSGLANNMVILLLLALFLASHQGIVSPVTWLILSEMFPAKVKARFMALSTTTIWLTNFVISLVYPLLIAALGTAAVFLIFTAANGVSVLLSLFVLNGRRIHKAYEKN